MIRGLRTHEGGFTLVELMVVMSVTIALLGSALIVFQGRVPRTQFASAINSLNVQLTDISNEVVSGYYPNQNNIQCSVNLGTGDIEIATSAQEQGTNQQCIFIGRAIQFGAGTQCPSVPNDKCGQIDVYTVVGKRVDSSGNIATTLEASEPIITTVSKSSFSLGYGAYVTKVMVGQGAAAPTVGGVAYLQSFGGSKLTGSDIPTGAPQVGIVPLRNTVGLGVDEATFATSSVGSATPPVSGLFSAANPKEGITVCLRSGGSDQYALLRIAVDGRTNISELKVVDEPDWNTVCN